MERGQASKASTAPAGEAERVPPDGGRDPSEPVDRLVRLNEERYRALVYASADVVWTMDGGGGHQIEEALFGLEDRTWSAFTGQSPAQLQAEGWLAAVHPDDREQAGRIWQDALARGAGFEAEYRLRRHDGVYRVMFDRGVPLRDEAGRIVQWIGATIDVTERRATEAERERLLAAVAAERGLLTAVLDQLPVGVVIAEAPSGQTILSNRQAAVILGDPPSAASAEPLVRAVARAETVRDAPIRQVRTDGDEGILSASAAPIRDASGAIVAGVAVYFDLTERAREEERQRFLATASAALAASLDYEAAVQELVDLIVPAIADACVVDVVEPDGAIRSLAVAAGPETRAVLDELRARYPASIDRPAGVARVIATGQPSFWPVIDDERRRAIARDDEHYRLLVALGTCSNITVALRARGEILGALTLKRIASAVPYGTADLVFAEELARRAALGLDNARLLREARTAVHLRDDFLSSASHDLKNPLTTIQGRVQLLRRKVERGDGIDGESATRGLNEIAAAANKLQGIIDELQDVSSLQIGRPLALQRRPTDLVALVRQEIEHGQRTTSVHRLRLESGLPSLVVQVDPVRLHRVLDNLLTNAIKYSPAGGEIVVALGTETGPAGDFWAVLGVRDEGIGIPAVDVPHLFERFFRGSNVSGQIAGTGIGLTGSRQIVQQHGGTISVESREGLGSTFTVRLPIDNVDTVESREGRSDAGAANPGGTHP
jgi:PAS domain S-box-containing protein